MTAAGLVDGAVLKQEPGEVCIDGQQFGGVGRALPGRVAQMGDAGLAIAACVGQRRARLQHVQRRLHRFQIRQRVFRRGQVAERDVLVALLQPGNRGNASADATHLVGHGVNLLGGGRSVAAPPGQQRQCVAQGEGVLPEVGGGHADGLRHRLGRFEFMKADERVDFLNPRGFARGVVAATGRERGRSAGLLERQRIPGALLVQFGEMPERPCFVPGQVEAARAFGGTLKHVPRAVHLAAARQDVSQQDAALDHGAFVPERHGRRDAALGRRTLPTTSPSAAQTRPRNIRIPGIEAAAASCACAAASARVQS